jgi:hypothetical protein
MTPVGSGMIQGGWEFVWSAYGLTWVVLAVYLAWVLRAALRPSPPRRLE